MQKLVSLAEFLGCGSPLGILRTNITIPDNRLTASSHDPHFPAAYGRLYLSGWAPKSRYKEYFPHFQVNLGAMHLVCGFEIQGCLAMGPRSGWVTRYRVQVSPEKDYWDDWNFIKVWFLPVLFS